MSTLPALLVLTDRRQARRPLTEVISAVLDCGARAVVLREKDLPRADRAALAADIAPLVHAAGGLLISAGELLPGCDGVHLAAAQAGPPSGAELVGRSCHSSEEVLQAADVVDYVTVSPVYVTSSKPGYGPGLGIDGLAALVAAASVPVYALGGVSSAEQVRACVKAGAAGVAVMGAVMRADNPAGVVTTLNTAITGALA